VSSSDVGNRYSIIGSEIPFTKISILIARYFPFPSHISYLVPSHSFWQLQHLRSSLYIVASNCEHFLCPRDLPCDHPPQCLYLQMTRYVHTQAQSKHLDTKNMLMRDTLQSSFLYYPISFASTPFFHNAVPMPTSTVHR
jgi:hypothetical protein